MTIRLRMLVTLFALLTVAGASVLWFTVFREQPKPAEAKTTAELLVGSWKMTKCDYPPIAPQVEILLVLTHDGRFETHTADPVNGLQVRLGTYRLEGNTIHFSAGPTDRLDAMSWDELIEVITEDKLVLVGVPEPNGRPRMELQRTTEKLAAPPRLLPDWKGDAALLLLKELRPLFVSFFLLKELRPLFVCHPIAR